MFFTLSPALETFRIFRYGVTLLAGTLSDDEPVGRHTVVLALSLAHTVPALLCIQSSLLSVSENHQELHFHLGITFALGETWRLTLLPSTLSPRIRPRTLLSKLKALPRKTHVD